MASALPYLQSYKNVEKLFKNIQAAKQPEAFTHKFLNETIGLKAVTDRPLIAFLRTLGFLDASSKPTSEYAALKNETQVSRAIARAIRRAYAPLFAANENAHRLPSEQLKGLIAQIAGSDTNTTNKIAGTLNALLRLADFTESNAGPLVKPTEVQMKDDRMRDTAPSTESQLRPEFHYNIQIHLPANGTEETYLNIFNALRKVFK